MSCIITYKGNQYSEQEFKKYFNSNTSEFIKEIANSKNVIDSFKNKIDAINYVFQQAQELESIGTKTQYLKYLSTIFPNSKVKDIVYHGSPVKGLQEIKRGTDNQGKMYTSKYGITFTNNDLTASIYAGQISLDPNVEDNLDSGQVYSVLLNIKNPTIKDFNNDSYGGKFGSAMGTYNNTLETAFKEGKDGFIAKRIADPVQDQTNLVVFKPEQIHILGSKQDIEGFKEFVEKGEVEKKPFEKTKENITFTSQKDLENLPDGKPC